MRTHAVRALAIATMIGATPAHAHGDMAALAVAQLFFGAVAVVFAIAAAALAAFTVRAHRRPSTTSGDVFRAGLLGVSAIVAFAFAGASFAGSFEQAPAGLAWFVVVVPALLALQLFVSAAAYKRVGAGALRVGSIVLGVLFVLVAAFAAIGVAAQNDAAAKPSSPARGA